jgi:(S)-ureidoglycine aminohydrolase
MMQRLEMHMTILKGGLQSHEPHTHVAEEIMIVISGNVDMQIGQQHYKAAPGDLVFIKSGELHAPKNDGKGECSYFAIQFQ